MRFSTKSMISCALLSAATLCSVPGNARQGNTDNTILAIERNKTDNTPVLISFSQNANWKPAQAQDIFKQYLGISTDITMQLQYSTTTKMDVTSDRYAEYYKGIKVEYGSFTLMSKDGRVNAISGNYYNIDNATPAIPAISEAGAFNSAIGFVGAVKYMWQDPAEEARIKSTYNNPDTSYLPKGQLVWIEDFNHGNDSRKLHLAWAFNVYAIKPMSRQMVYIDAIDGKVLYSNSLIKHTAATGHSLYSGVIPFVTSHVGATYELYDSTRGNGVHTLNMHTGTSYAAATEFTNAADTWPSAAADTAELDAHWAGEMVYDYWKNVQGRLSWDNLNGILLQYVHYSTAYDNAFWNGTEMTYGDGSGCAGGGFTALVSLDVTAHEIGPGVCQATCNLVYSKEPGGIDEGLSDCWGATIENYANPHEVDAVPKQQWWMGEEIGCGTPLRRLDFPKLYGLPDTYNGTNWYNVTGCTPGGGNDQCGVHTNMGVISKWYYLLTAGGSGTNDIGNTYSVTGQTYSVSQNVLYQTELILSSTATYSVLRTTSIAAATTLYGACSAQVQAVTDAWYAVGVGTAFVPCYPTLGFVSTIQSVTEKAGTTTCPASHTVNIPIQPVGPAIAGGTATVNVTATSGTAVAGVDYTLSSTTLTWAAGDASTKNVVLTVFDNGAVYDDKTLTLTMALSAGTSNATISPANDTVRVNIYNDDSIPQLGTTIWPVLNAGTIVTCNITSAFEASKRKGHLQFMLQPAELTAAGVRPNVPISQIAFDIITKNSTTPFVGYTVAMANSASADLSTAFATGLTTVYTGNVTTNAGWDSLNFTTNFSWDGTSNVVVDVCYGYNAAAAGANDLMFGIQNGATIFDSDYPTGTGTGCGAAYSAAGQNTARPVVRFRQVVPPAPIATTTTSTYTWDVHAGQQVYFYTATLDSLVAGLNNISNDLGCVTATVTQAGVGFTPAVFSPINRSLKEISITPTINGSITTYDATMYLTNTELNAVAAGTLFLLKTDAPTDATVSTANSIEVTPTLITGTNYVGFKGTFTGFSRFFLVDGPLCNPPAATITPAGSTTFCSPGSVVLNANTGTGLTYQWEAGGTPITGATTAAYTASVSGTYNVVVYKGTTCDSTSLPVVVTVNSVSVTPINGASAVCIGQTTALTDATGLGVWTSANPTYGTVSTSGVVTGLSAGVLTISYAVTNSCGTATATTTLNVTAGVVVAPVTGSTFAVCSGSNITLTDATASGTWSSSNAAVATVAGGTVTGHTAGTANISYNVTSGSGCVSSAVATVTVNALPSAVIAPAGSVVVCTGATVTFTAPSGTGITYQWQSGGAAIPGATSATYNTSTAGTYNFIASNSATGCTATSGTATLTISSGFTVVPSLSIASSLGTVLCAPASAETFTATPVNGGTTPVLQWSVNGTATGTGATYSYTPANGDVVSCLLTSNAACAYPDTASASELITVTPLVSPSVGITSIHHDTTCTGDTVQFAAVPLYGGTAPTYLWTENGINVATGPYYIYMPHNGDTLIVTMTSNYPCLLTPIAVSNLFIIQVDAPTVNSLAVSVSQSSVVSGSVDTFTAVASGAGMSPGFQWYINGNPVAGATGYQYITDSLQEGQIVSCLETSSFACAEPYSVMSGGISVSVLPSGVAQVGNGAGSFTLLPNPNAGSFTIKGSLGRPANDEVNIVVTDMLGQAIYKRTTTASNGKVNEQVTLPGTLAQGMYLVSITSGGQHVVFHVSVEK